MKLEDIISYWMNAGLFKLIRVFWYFFIFEFLRFLILDYIVIVIYMIKRYVNRDKWSKARDDLFNEMPFVSIIVPGKNEGKHLYKLTRSLQEQTYKNFELIVVDDGSTDDTRIIGKSLQNNGYIDLFISNDVRGGKASGANVALQYSRGKFVVHLDADCSFDRDAIEKSLIPFYYDERIGAVGGNLEVRNADAGIASTLQAIEYLKVIQIGRMVTSYLGIYRIISGAFGTFRKDVLDRVGGWDVGPGLDGDITVKIRKMGYKVHFEHTAIGLTNAPATFKALSKQRLRWDRSIIRFRLRKHKNVFEPNAEFKLTNMFSSLENIFYNIILNLKWYIYAIDIITNYSNILLFILPMNFFLYTCSNYIQFFAVMLFTKSHYGKHKYLLYIPLIFIYNGFYLRIVRTIAHFRELVFRSSYNDNWNPAKSSNLARLNKI
jgi:biofilm PGA synthesis N-glycosyltransferase PgaC